VCGVPQPALAAVYRQKTGTFRYFAVLSSNNISLARLCAARSPLCGLWLVPRLWLVSRCCVSCCALVVASGCLVRCLPCVRRVVRWPCARVRLSGDMLPYVRSVVLLCCCAFWLSGLRAGGRRGGIPVGRYIGALLLITRPRTRVSARGLFVKFGACDILRRCYIATRPSFALFALSPRFP